jgi:hypothetical protein
MAVMESTPGMSIEILIRHYVFFIECIWSIAAPGVEDQMITIEDVAGVGPRMLTPRILKFIRAVTTIIKVKHAISIMNVRAPHDIEQLSYCLGQHSTVIMKATDCLLLCTMLHVHALDFCVFAARRTTTWSAVTAHSSSMLPTHSLWCGRCACAIIILLIVISTALAIRIKLQLFCNCVHTLL